MINRFETILVSALVFAEVVISSMTTVILFAMWMDERKQRISWQSGFLKSSWPEDRDEPC